MLLGVMSDSHDNLEAVSIALKIFRDEDIEILIHLGDIISPFTFMRIIEFPAKIIALLGNNDGDTVYLKEIAVKAGATIKQNIYILNIDGKKMLLVHGFGTAEQTKEIIDSIAFSGKYNVILYGHTHKAEAYTIGKSLVLNPGEVCGYLTNKKSVAVIDTTTMKYRIIEF